MTVEPPGPAATTNGAAVDREVVYPHPPERVWRALTDPDALSRWLLPTSDFAPAPGQDFSFQPGVHSEPQVIGEVLESDAPHRLRYTWRAGEDQLPTIVTWTLEPAERGGTRVRLRHETVPAPTASARTAMIKPIRRPLPARRSFTRRPAPVRLTPFLQHFSGERT